MKGEFFGKKLLSSKRPKIFKVIHEGEKVSFELKKVSKRRFIRIAMALGVPAREAQLMAEYTRMKRTAYADGIVPLLRSVLDVTDNPQVEFWIFTWLLALPEQ